MATVAHVVGPVDARRAAGSVATRAPARARSPSRLGVAGVARANHATLPPATLARLPSTISTSLRRSGAPLPPSIAADLGAGLAEARAQEPTCAADAEPAAERIGRRAAAWAGTAGPVDAVDLDAVRIHTDARAGRSALAASARAYTVGSDIVFAPGRFAPATPSGRALLGHELAHVGPPDGPGLRRDGMPFDPAAIALLLRDAMEGLGTDELTIYAALAGRDQAQDDAIAAAYLQLTGRTLSADLQDELSSGELLTLAAVAPEALPSAEARATAVAMRLRDAMEGLGTNEAAVFAALSGRTATEVAAIRVAYRQLTGVELEAGLRDEMSGDELQQAFGTMGRPATIYEQNTELGGLSVGNFDFHLRDGRITVWIWLKFQFTDEITAAQRAAFKQRFLAAVHGRWANTGWHLEGGTACPTPDIPIEIHAQETTGGFYHKLVDVEDKTSNQRRENVMRDINVNLWTDDIVLAHEFGHVLGLYDEYVGPWIENIMFWHKNVPGDPSALMYMETAASDQMRARYFEHYRRRVQATAPPGCEYRVSAPTPPGPGPSGP